MVKYSMDKSISFKTFPLNLKEASEEVKAYREKMETLVRDYTKELSKQRNDFFEKHLFENAIPKLTKPLTARKIKIRGIRLICLITPGGDTIEWIEQKGIRISPKLNTHGTSRSQL